MDRILVTGATGLVGEGLCRRLGERARVIALVRDRVPDPPVAVVRCDLADADAITAAVHAVRPSAIVHLAAMSGIGECAADPARAAAINVRATARLAELATARGIRLVFSSSDQVFDGRAAPYGESAATAPLTEYARNKVAAEHAVLAAGNRHLVCRVALSYGPCRGAIRQLDWMLARARAGDPVELFADEWRTPIDSLTLADALAELVASDVVGVLHLAGPERIDRLALGRRLLAAAGLDPALARPASRAGHPDRPADVSLATHRARALLRTPLLDVDAGLRRIGLDPAGPRASAHA